MNLNKVIELDTLKHERNQISQQIANLIKSKIKECFEMAVSDFNDFFNSKGFALSNENKQTNAQLGNIKISIKIHEEDYIGSYSLMELNVDGPIKTEYTIRINELDHLPAGTRTMQQPRDENEKILLEIENEKKAISEAQKSLEQKQKMRLGFSIIEKKENSFVNKYPKVGKNKKAFDNTPYESFQKLLENTFKDE